MTAKHSKIIVLAAYFGLFALGCSGKSVGSVGDVNAPTAGSGGDGDTNAAAGARPASTEGGGATAGSAAGGNTPGASGASAAGTSAAGAPGDIDGTWHGYIENYKNGDGTDTVEVRIDQGGMVGQLVFGEAMAPPPATDPEADYPPGANANTDPLDTSGPDVGFVFTLVNASFNGTRLQFDVAPNELYQSWCALQTSYKDDYNAGSYRCLPNWGYMSDVQGSTCWQTDPTTMTKIVRSCAQLRLCTGATVCSCTSTSCMAPLATSVHFDLMVAVPKADGSVAGLDGMHNVHLMKQ